MRKFIFWFTLLFATTSLAQVVPTVSLTASPTSGQGSIDVTLIWSSTNATSCLASGSWSGTKALNGTQSISNLVTNASYTLTCSAAGGTATLTWVAPTTRTDGSPLTNLAQYRIYSGTSSTALSLLTSVAVPATSFLVTNLLAGPTFFAITAVDAVNLESVRTGVVSKNVTVPTASATAIVTVQSLPNPPTISPVVAGINMSPVYRVSAKFFGGYSRGTAVLGHAPVGVSCSGSVVYKYRERNYYTVTMEDVNWEYNVTPVTVAGPCS